MKVRHLHQNINALLNHPLNRGHKAAAFLRVVKWQMGTRLLPGSVVFDWVGGARTIVRRGDTGMTANVYYGLRDFPEMAYVLHALTPEDLFVDVGANVGAFTLLACGAAGARGYCFEPVPSSFARLMDNLVLNQLTSRVVALNMGLADKDGDLAFTTDEQTQDHVLAPDEVDERATRIPVRRIDSVLTGESPAMIKIDVEGFETPVLAGAESTLRSPALHSVLIELNGSGNRYGYEEGAIVRQMGTFGFTPCDYEPFSRKLTLLNGKHPAREDTLFVRDIDRMRSVVAQAPRRSINSVEF